MNQFLQRYGWSMAAPVAEDGSSRRYFRARKGEQSAILMQVIADTPGHRISDFIRIGAWLKEIGLKTPEIYEADEKSGYLLLEDFGDTSFKAALMQGWSAQELYALAADVLKHLQAQDCPLELPAYDQSHVHKNHRYVMDWYVPAVKQQPLESIDEYLAVWKKIEDSLPPCPQGFLHVDFHVENLMWLPLVNPPRSRGGIGGRLNRCGILDFQGAMKGPLAYDLANLLEDVRTDVPPAVKTALLQDYDEDFRRWTRILGTQFHCRVIGQFLKMAAEDGKTRYLEHIPRIAGYIQNALEDPVLKPLKAFFSEQKVDFDPSKPLNFTEIRRYIPPKAS